MKRGKNEGPKAPILFKIEDGGDVADEAAETEAWERVAEGFEAALRVTGLTPSARDAFAYRLRLARECAGLPPTCLRSAPQQQQRDA